MIPLRRKQKSDSLPPGTALGPYRVERLVGEGGMGAVYRASAGGRPVALKVLKDRLSKDAEVQRRFRHEARAASQIQHKHLVPLVDFGEVDGRPYLVMPFVGGQTLEERIAAGGPLPLHQAVRMTGQVASALDAIHAHGLVHRDVKSSNIMIDEEGSASLTDFGLAKGKDYSTLTKPGQIVGTLDYLAPERIRGHAADPKSDIYALGCVVFEAVAGTPPFAGASLLELGTQVLTDAPPDPCAGRPDAPPHLSETILLALAKDPAARPPTAVAYANMLTVCMRSA